MAGHFEGNVQQLHYGRRRRRWPRRSRRAACSIPERYVEGTGRLRIDAVLTCDDDWALLHELIQAIEKHFLIDHPSQAIRKEAMVVTGDPRQAELFGQVERLARETEAPDGWLITHANWSRQR